MSDRPSFRDRPDRRPTPMAPDDPQGAMVPAAESGSPPARVPSSATVERRLWHRIFDQSPAILLLVDPSDGRVLEASQAAATFYGVSRARLRRMHMADLVVPHPADDGSASKLESGAVPVRSSHRLANGELRVVDVDRGSIRFGGRTVVQYLIHDVTDHVAASAERDRLAAAVEQSAETVVITDRDATIVYVNPAFERVTGFTRAEAIGANPRILKSGQQAAELYAAMWASLTARETWHGEFVNRRKDGRELIEEASITPIVDHDGIVRHYVGVKRDVTVSRAIRERMDGTLPDQGAMASMLANLSPGETAEDSARAVCDRVLTLAGVTFAALAVFVPGDRLRTLAAIGLDRVPIRAIEPVGPWPVQMQRRVRQLRQQADTGPTIEDWHPGLRSPMRTSFRRLGIGALALVPVTKDGASIGFLQLGASGHGARAALEAALPTLQGFGVLASLLLGPSLLERARVDRDREAVQSVIERRAFRPVFQPIFALGSRAIVGYEALTRFTDDVSPDEQFATAARVGLGLELELATMQAAIEAARTLPHDAWLDLNASRDLLEDTNRLAYLLWKAGSRPLVLEITEHQEIGDYDRVRARLAALGIPVRLAVDDAGAGFASLRHILELRPDIIKLDRSLVTAIDRDPVRQGLVAGLQHFAVVAGATLIAEGIESAAEAQTLAGLGVELGQGYLLGEPRSVRTVRRPARVPQPAAVHVRIDELTRSNRPELLHRVNAILWEADGTDERMTFVSQSAAALTGHQPGRWLSEPQFWENHLHPDDRPSVLQAIGDALHHRAQVSLEYRFQRADGTYRWFEDLVEVVLAPDGHARLIGVMIDVTDRRRLVGQLAYRASHDPMTDLLNRQGFEGVVETALPLADGTCGAVLAFDLDDFRFVNEGVGHRAGDETLKRVAARLRNVMGPGDQAARTGGDEFALLAFADDPEALADLAERLVAAMAAPADIDGIALPHPVSVGIAFIQADDSAESILRNAVLAMHAAKAAGGNCLRRFDRRMHDAAVARFEGVRH